jgi:hypothetical protein
MVSAHFSGASIACAGAFPPGACRNSSRPARSSRTAPRQRRSARSSANDRAAKDAQSRAQVAAGIARITARRGARAARPRQRGGADANARRRPDPPHPRPFDALRANRVLPPHDPKLKAIRWLIGESLRRTHQRARLDQLRAVALDRLGGSGGGASRPPRLTDRHPHHHRRSGRARLPRLRPRARHPLASRRRRSDRLRVALDRLAG